jgi:GT2 family glycosyltransferase
MSAKFRFVCATREPQEKFFTHTALGRSLALYNSYGSLVQLRLFPGNSAGLPVLYNTALSEAAGDPAILIFAHDDVYLCDFFWPTQVLAGLGSFDIVGLAGNRRRTPRQPAWHMDTNRAWDAGNLSGVVGSGKGFPPDQLNMYGPPCQQVKLLDGVMLIARSETLLSKQIRFDERFDFNFYDLDFCRQAEERGLRMGTWSISVVHESAGSFYGPSWDAGYAKYLEKWQS